MIRAAFLLMWFALAAPGALAYSSVPLNQVQELRFHQHMGAPLPLDTTLRDEAGRPVRLGDFFLGKPVVLILDYLRCRTLCGFVLQDTAAALSRTPLAAGRDYEVLAISIDPRDGPAEAREARETYLARFGRPQGWHFLTGDAAASAAVAAAVGFPYRYDPAIDQYVHPAGITVATPQGVIARYVLGVGYKPLDVRLAITEASAGTISSPASDVLLLCYCYDPGTGRYSFAIGNVTRAVCGATVIGLGCMLASLARARRS